jgi:hypothetical protein
MKRTPGPGPYGYKWQDDRTVFIKQPDGTYAVYTSIEGHSVSGYPAEENPISAMTLHCRESVMRLCGQPYSVYDGKDWEHHAARETRKAVESTLPEDDLALLGSLA